MCTIIMFCCQAAIGFPVHPFGFPTIAIEYARLPFKFTPNFVSSTGRPIISRFPLAFVGELITMSASEVFIAQIQLGNSFA
jgi:hypothetical protein